MSNEDARYQQGQTALLRLAVAAHDAVNKVIVPVDGDEFVTLPEGCPVFPGETVAGGERHLSAIDVLRYLVNTWDEAHEDSPPDTPVVTITNPPGQEGAEYRLTLPTGESRTVGDAQDHYWTLANVLDDIFEVPEKKE